MVSGVSRGGLGFRREGSGGVGAQAAAWTVRARAQRHEHGHGAWCRKAPAGKHSVCEAVPSPRCRQCLAMGHPFVMSGGLARLLLWWWWWCDTALPPSSFRTVHSPHFMHPETADLAPGRPHPTQTQHRLHDPFPDQPAGASPSPSPSPCGRPPPWLPATASACMTKTLERSCRKPSHPTVDTTSCGLEGLRVWVQGLGVGVWGLGLAGSRPPQPAIDTTTSCGRRAAGKRGRPRPKG